LTLTSQDTYHAGNGPFVLSVDPGKRIGVALWMPQGVLLWKVVMDFEELSDWLDSEGNVNVIVAESYRLDHRAGRQKGSKLEASQVIGMLRRETRRRGIKYVEQPNGILRVTAMHAGLKVPAVGHIRDDISALLHGFRYFEDQGMRPQDIQL
jgi:hypothetical protein